MKPIWFYDPNYQQNYLFFHKYSRAQMSKWIKSEGLNKEIYEDSTGFCFHYSNGIGIWVERPLTTPDGMSDFVHECQHATMATLLNRGVTPTYENHEPFAYHIGMLVKQFIKLGGIYGKAKK